ncbi:hypothetical protein R0J87_15700 [Halomonas sp. SIMBA_159]
MDEVVTKGLRSGMTFMWVMMSVMMIIAVPIFFGTPIYFFYCLIEYNFTPLELDRWFLAKFFSNYWDVLKTFAWSIAAFCGLIQLLILITPVRMLKIAAYLEGINPPSNVETGKVWVRGHYRKK